MHFTPRWALFAALCTSLLACSPKTREAPAERATERRTQAVSTLNVLHSNDFEAGLNGWVAATTSGTGTWNVLSNPETMSVSSALNPYTVTLADNGAHLSAAGGKNVARFGDSTGTFIGEDYPTQTAKNGGSSAAAQGGTLTSPTISLAGVAKTQLEFDSWWEVEGVASTSYDLLQIYVSSNGGTFTMVGQLNPSFAASQPAESAYSSGGPAAAPVWRHYAFDLSAYAGQNIQVRFQFHSGDTAYNAFRGFTIDNVVIAGGDALPAPTLSAITPSVATAGDLVSIEGANFQQGATFFLGATQIQASSITQFGSNTMIFKVPSMTAGTYDVKVVNPDAQQATLAAAFTYSTTASPVVSSITPATASTGVAQSVTVSGSNFATGAALMLGDTAATNVVVTSATQLTATAPALGAGTYNVKVINPSGQSGTLFAAYTVSDTSTISVVAPAGGESWASGTIQTISWTSSGTDVVSIDLYKGGSFALNIADSIQASTGSYSWTIPFGTTAGADYTIKIFNPLGTKSSTSAIFAIVEGTPSATTTTVSSSANPSASGAPVTFTATISPAPSAGTVQFKIDGAAFGAPVTVTGGSATSGAISTLTSGTHTVTAEYSGTTGYGTSTGSLTQSVNHVPVADPQTVNVSEDGAAGITLTASDADGDALTWVVTAQPSHGTLTGTAPNLTYTPAADYAGADSFSFKVNDGVQDSAQATVSITVAAVNDAPVATAQSVQATEDTQAAITLTASDVEGDALTYVIVTAPTHGSLTGTPPNLTYSPAANYHGPDSFTFKATDGSADSAPATVSISVASVNDAPIAQAQARSVDEDASVSLTLLGVDVEGAALSYTVATQPAHGTLSGTAPNLIYTPQANFHGADSFTFVVDDGALTSAPATVTLDVTSINDAPEALPQAVTTAEDASASIALAANDVEGSSLTWIILTQPANGVLSGTAPNLTYTPNAHYHGSDSFTFKVNDGAADSNVATVSLTISSVNDAPTAAGNSLLTAEDTAVNVTLAGSDADGDALTYTVVAQPAHGTLSGTAPNLTYLPASNYHGADSFSFIVNDGQSDSAAAAIAVTITSVNDAPVADASSDTTDEDTPVGLTLSGSDVEGSALSFIIVTQPAHGSLSGSAPNLTYSPDADYHGPDSFTFAVADDALAQSEVVTVTLAVAPINDLPTATAQFNQVNEDEASPFTLTGDDVDGDALTFSVIQPPAHGTLTGTAPSVVYTPAADYSGPDSFTFVVNDGTANSAPATVSIDVGQVNDAPIAVAQALAANEDETIAVTLAGTDTEADALTFTVVQAPAHGTLSGTAPALQYTPTADHHGADSFTFKVNDGQVDSAVATVTLTLNSVNDAPVAVPLSTSTPEDTEVALTLAGTDVDGDALTFEVVAQPAHGTLAGAAPGLRYQPAAHHTGPDSFTFRVNDGTADSQVVTVSIEVGPVNDAPVAEGATIATDEDQPVTITLLAADADADALTYTIVSPPANGTLQGDAPAFTYVPGANFHGSDSFTFRVSDGVADSNVATVDITIASVDDVPTAEAQAVVLSEDTATDIKLHGADVEGAALTFTVLTQPSHGTVSGKAPALVYRASGDYEGEDSFTFKVTADGVDSAEATVSITVEPMEDSLRGGGVGCSSAGGSGLPFLIAALVGLLTPWRRRSLAALVGAAAVVAPVAAQAQAALPELEAEALRFNPGAAGGLVTESGQLLDRGALRLGVAGHYEYEPLLYFRNGERVGAVIKDRATAHLSLGWSPLEWLEVGAQLPVVFAQRGDDLSGYGLQRPDAASAGTTLLQARASLWQQRRGSLVDLSFGLGVGVPVGSDGSLARDGGLGFSPRASVGRAINGWLRVGAELGAALRPAASFDAQPISRNALEGGVVVHTTGDRVRGELAWRGAVPFGGGRMTSEVLAGVRVPVGSRLEMFGIGGLGLGQALGTPMFRFLAGVAMPFGMTARSEPVRAQPEVQQQQAAAPVTPAQPPVLAPEPEVAHVPEVVAAEPAAPSAEQQRADINAQIAAELQGVRMFQASGSEVAPGARAALDRVAALLKAHPDLGRIRIGGHTCSSGSAKKNVALSRSRAEIVLGYLLGQGLRADRMQAEGFGSAQPLTSNETPEGRELNRRVEITVTPDDATVAPGA